jgi:DNA-3-methyladenine glycosylase
VTYLPSSFYLQKDACQVAKQLLGKFLFTYVEGQLTGGLIVETEAYCGVEDKASHAYGGRKTARTKTMYNEGGCAYIYLCYGMHTLFNVVTNEEGIPDAVLIRAIYPLFGIEVMQERRGLLQKQPSTPPSYLWTCGPGKVAQALRIERSHQGASLQGPLLWIEDRNWSYPAPALQITPRIGVDYAKEWAKAPFRFVLDIKYLAAYNHLPGA